MPKAVPAAIVAVILLGIFALMVRAWRARMHRDSGLVTALVPDRPAALLAAAEGFYVATTRGRGTLERLALRGLAYRGRVHVEVTAAGVILAVRGEQPVFLPAPDLRGIGTATATVDRVVEQGGLVVIAWDVRWAEPTRTPELAETHLRFPEATDRTRVLDALTRLVAETHPENSTPDGDIPDHDIPESEA